MAEQALVEHEVDDAKNCGETVGAFLGFRFAVRDMRIHDLSLGAGQALRQRRLGNEKGPCDLLGGQPDHGAQRECDLCGFVQGWMTAGEQQPAAVVRLPVQGLREGADGLQSLTVTTIAAEPVDRLVACRREQPGTRAVRDALLGPTPKSFDGGIGDDILGKVEVAKEADQARREPARLLPEHPVKRSARAVSGRQAAVPRSCRPARGTTLPG